MKILVKNKHWKLNEEYNIDKILYLLIDRPDYVVYINKFVWRKNVNCHRDYDLPSYISDVIMAWKKYDLYHRNDNKPARIFHNGLKEYYINNKFIKVIKEEK